MGKVASVDLYEKDKAASVSRYEKDTQRKWRTAVTTTTVYTPFTVPLQGTDMSPGVLE